MAHAFTAHLGNSDFYAALFTNNAAVLESLVFAAQALVVFDRTKNLGTKQTIALWLEGTVVNGFGLANFPV